MSNMLLHCGAHQASREAVYATDTPEATRTHHPIPHSHLIEEVEGQLETAGFELGEQRHALSHQGERYFGTWAISSPGKSGEGYTWVVGLRNSHDKRFAAGLVAGTRVFVCDNLAFAGEIQISRKHTRYVERDLAPLTVQAVSQLGGKLEDLDKKIELYRETEFSPLQAHHAIVKALDVDAITPRMLLPVLDEWRNPRHQEFRPRTAWSLFNAVTEHLKGSRNPATVTRRTQALHDLFDNLVLPS